MTIRSFAAALLLTIALTPVMAPAMAQTVSDQAIGDFVDSHSATTRLEKIARWEEGVCPHVTGLPANFIKFITKRVRDVATQVGAPVNEDENCKGNIEIVFTTPAAGAAGHRPREDAGGCWAISAVHPSVMRWPRSSMTSSPGMPFRRSICAATS
jgi:hypothetical protein